MGLADPSRRLPTFFRGSTSVRTEACSSDPPVVLPSATPHVLFWFCLKGKPSRQESDNPFQKPWIEEKTPSTICAYVCAYVISLGEALQPCFRIHDAINGSRQ